MTDLPAARRSAGIAHGLRRMTGRDPHESGRTATPLELLFDLTFVVAFGVAGEQAAHLLAEGHWAPALIGFGFAMFAVTWAWINFSWFASAFDTDDWVFRAWTMLQMGGVIVLALGLPDLFHSLDEGDHVDNRVMVAGYVIMRISMVAQWLRVARQDPDRRPAAATYVWTILVAQAGWLVALVLETSLPVTLAIYAVLILVEVLGPALAESPHGTPWHAHHIAERYGLLAIIALGEGIIGTVAAVSAVVEEQGWSVPAAGVAVAGTAVTFGMWWAYFALPFGQMLHHHRERSFGWGYGHILLFAGIAGTGAGLHVAAYFIEEHSELGAAATVGTVAVPLAVYLGLIYLLYTLLLREYDPFHGWLLAATAVALVAPVVLAAAGLPMVVCLLLLAVAPFVTVVGYETVGHRHLPESLRGTAPAGQSANSAR